MVELLVVAVLGFTALLVVGTLLTVFSVVGWFLWLPFKILGWMFKLVGLLFALPFILLACFLGGGAMLLGTGVLLLPLFPLLLVAGFLWWLLGPKHKNSSQARVVS